MNFKSQIYNVSRLSVYNAKIIFGNRFFYALAISVAMFLLITSFYIFGNDNVAVEDMYDLLRVPGLLLLIYPTLMGIQNDADSRTLEIIFGIPDYRFKVWLVRIIMVFVLVFIFLIPLAALLNFAVLSFPVFPMIMSLMPLLLFAGSLGFALSCIIKNGMGAAVFFIVLGIVLMIVFKNFSDTFWNIYLNPYSEHGKINDVVWDEMLTKNRIFLLVSTVVFILAGLNSLQNREKFLA